VLDVIHLTAIREPPQAGFALTAGAAPNGRSIMTFYGLMPRPKLLAGALATIFRSFAGTVNTRARTSVELRRPSSVKLTSVRPWDRSCRPARMVLPDPAAPVAAQQRQLHAQIAFRSERDIEGRRGVLV